jgi:hypothetical protein
MTPILSFEAHQTRALLDRASALLVRSRRLLAEFRGLVTGPFYLPSNTERKFVASNVAAQRQRSGNEDALTNAIDLITFDCRARASEWRRAGDVERAEAFLRVAAVVGAIE